VLPSRVGFEALLTNIGTGWENLTGENTTAYLAAASVSKKTSLSKLTPDGRWSFRVRYESLKAPVETKEKADIKSAQTGNLNF
jgi:hypothetical protein